MLAFVFTKKVISIDEIHNYDTKQFSYAEGIEGLNRLKRECEICNQGPAYKLHGILIQTNLFFIPVSKMYERHFVVCNHCEHKIDLEDSESKALNLLKKKYEKDMGILV